MDSSRFAGKGAHHHAEERRGHHQAHTVRDTSAPSPVLSLGAMPGASPGSVELNWIAPGDDGNTGTAAQYMVRYNIVPITETITATNWISCTDVTGEPVPSPAGSNVRVSLCEHDDFYGICETFAVDDPYLGDNVHP